MSIHKTVRTNIGATEEINLKAYQTTGVLLTFTGSNVGDVVVTAKVAGGDKFETVLDGTIDLASKKYVYIPEIPLDAVYITYNGVAQLDVAVFQIG